MKGPAKAFSTSMSSFLIKTSISFYLYKMNLAKVQFSEEEFAIVQNAALLLTKNRVIEKVHQTFVDLSQQLTENYKHKLSGELIGCQPGITKGEKLKGLPWVVLDYPRHFDRENILALRTIFWWGHDLIITLHLKGCYLPRGIAAIYKNSALLKDLDFVVCCSGDEWEHALDSSHVIPLKETASLEAAPFVKLSVSIPLNTWNENFPEKLAEMHAIFAKLIED